MKINDCDQAGVVEVLQTVDIDKIFEDKISACRNLENSDDSFYICDVGDIVKKHNLWLETFTRIKPFYAVKCNTDKNMLKSLMAMGTGFDCASRAEIERVLSLGVDPDNIIFANPCKQSSHIKYAKAVGVQLIVFDNEAELRKIKKIYPEANLVLRIVTDDSASICRFSMKFGADITLCPDLLLKAKQLGLNVVGISFHVGSGCQDPKAYIEPIKNARNLFDVGATLGFNFNLLDTGGGFSGSPSEFYFVKKTAAVINQTLTKMFPEHDWPQLKIIAEPGRFYAASAFSLITNVIAKREVETDISMSADDCEDKSDSTTVNTIKAPTFMYYVNDGLYGSFNCLFYDHAIVKPNAFKKDKFVHSYRSSIWGPTCDGLDKLVEHCMFPELDIGDWISWLEMGAYTMAAGSSFNGFKTSKIHYVISEKDMDLFTKLSNKTRPLDDVLFEKKPTDIKNDEVIMKPPANILC